MKDTTYLYCENKTEHLYVVRLKSDRLNTRSANPTISLDKKASGDPGDCVIRVYTKWYDTST